jgi:TRAP-type C4-dicarboxylate transport system permease small subunit
MSDERPLSPEAERAIAKVRRLMMIASGTIFLAVAAVLIVIGYRVSQLGESAPQPADGLVDVTAVLPAGAKVLSTALSNEHIMVTVETPAGVELLTFDPDTLKPLGRLRLQPKP